MMITTQRVRQLREYHFGNRELVSLLNEVLEYREAEEASETEELAAAPRSQHHMRIRRAEIVVLGTVS